ncbi:hypothetical protein CK500_10330 [Halorubrum salipaludis]|uniref:Methanogenesis regulatory protein FilR1 middle domain-containing protein n=2 Tax=Halorubrum salipaludis TaxID=2032630 RepID=A0A2A2FF84_9EURY|nr:hypothetical protein [Halorubrum salipaludis]PAU83414.1 hypothetical protein CK500_10330 [Halorubrum salipaludis]
MADGDAPGAALRKLVAEAVGVERIGVEEVGVEEFDAETSDAETSDSEAIAAGLAERGEDPGPAARLPELVASGDSVVGVVPRADTALARRVLGNGDGDGEGRGVAREEGRTVRLVFTGRAADRLAGPSGAVIRSVLAEHGVDAHRHDGDSPIGVLLVGDRAVVGLFDDRGLAALLWSDAPAVREWAAATCRRYLAAAEPA